MILDVNINDVEDKILNTLNGILSITYDSDKYEMISKEVEELVNSLGKMGLINPREGEKH